MTHFLKVDVERRTGPDNNCDTVDASSLTPFSQPNRAQYLEGPRPMRVFHSGVVTASGPLLRAEPGFSELRRVCNKERRELY